MSFEVIIAGKILCAFGTVKFGVVHVNDSVLVSFCCYFLYRKLVNMVNMLPETLFTSQMLSALRTIVVGFIYINDGVVIYFCLGKDPFVNMY